MITTIVVTNIPLPLAPFLCARIYGLPSESSPSIENKRARHIIARLTLCFTVYVVRRGTEQTCRAATSTGYSVVRPITPVWGTGNRRFKSGYPDQFIEVLPVILHNCYGGRGCAGPERFGVLAQLVERLSGRQKVKGSIPLGSTKSS